MKDRRNQDAKSFLNASERPGNRSARQYDVRWPSFRYNRGFPSKPGLSHRVVG
jgi:hypothetical protein